MAADPVQAADQLVRRVAPLALVQVVVVRVVAAPAEPARAAGRVVLVLRAPVQAVRDQEVPGRAVRVREVAGRPAADLAAIAVSRMSPVQCVS